MKWAPFVAAKANVRVENVKRGSAVGATMCGLFESNARYDHRRVDGG
jgi:hypothetical protein